MNKKLLTSDVFSIGFLREHPLTKPIMERYHDIYTESSSFCIIGLPHSKEKIAAMAELDIVPVEKLLVRRFLDDFCVYFDMPSHGYEKQEFEEFEIKFDKYINARPYSRMVSGRERYLAALLALLWFDASFIYFHASPTKWQDAMIYLRYKNKRLFNLEKGIESTGEDALLDYQAVYVFEKMGRDRIGEFLDDFFNIEKFFEHSDKFFHLLNEAMGEDVTKKFVQQDEPRIISLEELEAILNDTPEDSRDKLRQLYYYPEWIEFTPEANSKIISLILEDKLSNEDIDYFLGTSEDVDDYVELYPAVKRVIQTTRDAHTLYTAGDVLDIIWRALPKDDIKLQGWFRKEVCNMFWPRIGDVWPIQHYSLLKLDDNQRKIFEDSLGWLMSLDNIAELNPELGNYLNSDSRLELESLKKRRFAMKHGEEGPEERYKHLADKGFSSYEWLRYSCYPTNKTEVDFVIQKITWQFDDERELSHVEIGALEYLLLHLGDYQDVGAYTLNKLLDSQWFWHIGSEYILPMFTAACEGVSNENELKPLRALAQKTVRYYEETEQLFFTLDDIKDSVETALKKAEHTVPREARQRENLSKNLRQHDEDIARIMGHYNPTNICCFETPVYNEDDGTWCTF